MPTNLAIEDRLIEEARKVGRHRRRKQLEVLSLFGKIDFDRGYDYKKERQRK
jgi:hypothetical protein